MTPGFTEIGPETEFLIFWLLLFLFFAVFSRSQWLSNKVGNVCTAVAGWTRRRRALPEHEINRELRKIDLARIAIGAFATSRYGVIFSLALANGSHDILPIAGLATGLSVMITLGLATPVALLLLMSSANILIDNALGASTLGTMVLSITLLFFLLAPAGRTLSLDALLYRNIAPRAIGAMYRFFGSVSADRVIVAKLAALVSYYCLCLYSISWHSHDEAWRSGLVINWVLLSPASNPDFSGLAWDAYQASPWAFVNFCRLSIIGMALWYVFLLPGLYLGRVFRYFIIFWGLAFFLISTFVLPLSYLGWHELIFWFVVFASGPIFATPKSETLSVLFDDRCNLCDRTVKILSWFDIFGRLVFMPIRRNMATAEKFDISLQEGLTDLVGVEEATGKRYDGYALYETITARVFLLWPAWPFLWLGRKLLIGPAIYRFVADRRTKLFGVCEFSTIPDSFTRFRSDQATPSSGISVYPAAVMSLLMTLAVLSLAFAVRLPLFSTTVDEEIPGRWVRATFGAAPLGFGIGKINVFNSEDLALFTLQFSAEMKPSREAPQDDTTTQANFISPTPIFNLSDRQKYFIVKHGRRMARMNIGCDKEYWRDTSAMYVESLSAAARTIPNVDLVVTASKASWPTANDLKTYTLRSPNVYVLCRARIDIATGKLIDLEFDQPGVDEALHQKGLPDFLKATTAVTALDYPSHADAVWLNTLVDTDADLSQRPELVSAARELFVSRYGEFQVHALFRAITIMQSNRDLDARSRISVSPDLCKAGLDLTSALVEAAGPDTVFRDELTQLQFAAREAQEAGDMGRCIGSSASVRHLYFQHILKPDVMNSGKM